MLVQTARGSLWVSGDLNTDMPTLILIHGAGGSRLQWPRTLRRIDGLRVLVLDLPGHGNSPGPGRDSIDAYADDLATLLDALHIERAIIAGHSMGGGIALQYALAHPARTAGLVLMGTGARLAVNPALLAQARDEPEVAARTMVDWVWSADTPQAARDAYFQALIALPPGTLYGDLLACDRFDVRERLGEIPARTLVLTGAHDRMTPPKFGDFLAARLPDAHLEQVDAGHMLMLEQPEAVGGLVRAWLA